MTLSAFAKLALDPPGMDEVNRILALAVQGLPSPEETEAHAASVQTPASWRSGFRLWPAQVAVDLAVSSIGGAFCPMPVSAGKAISSFLACRRYWETGKGRILLMVPSDLVTKSVRRDAPLAREVFALRAPIHVVAGLTPAERLHICRSGRRGIYLYPYSLARGPQAGDEIEAIDPEAIVADEAHALRGINQGSDGRRSRISRSGTSRWCGPS